KALVGLSESFDFDSNTTWFGENLMPINKNEIYELTKSAKDSIKKPIFKNAIILQNTDLRALPTKKPFFKNPSLAGEGYPFDYLQESRIYISSPVKILYQTQKRDYFFIKSPVGYGWVDARHIALTDFGFEKLYKNSPLATPVIDKKPLYGTDGEFVESLNVGTVFPKGYYPVATKGSRAVWKKYKINNNISVMPLKISDEDIALSAYNLYGEPYGWGGYLDNRDCSMFLRDIFVAFGIHLPRNSSKQAAGYTDISNLGTALKKEYILSNAKPFRTLVYLKGHIMLYVGKGANGEPLVMHDVWGIKSFENGKEGRKMLGGIVVTTMEEGRGEPWFDEDKSSLLVKTLGIKDIY
ncbi:MAG TPA: SH3 domain-containing protein, partial [Campylobacterales bacterium]|nr:SH3 domain-containing protein [Campylobacterales bacterium]